MQLEYGDQKGLQEKSLYINNSICENYHYPLDVGDSDFVTLLSKLVYVLCGLFHGINEN